MRYSGDLALQIQRSIMYNRKGKHGEVVTQADYIIEDYLREALSVYGYNILAEENGNVNANSDRTWIIDPIDATVNYLHGHPDWAISVGLSEKGAMKFGAILSPSDGRMYHAIEGVGAFLNGKPICVSEECEIQRSFVTSAYLDDMDRFQILMNQIWDSAMKVDVMGSMAKSLCYVAEGSYSGAIALSSKVWDHAAGALILEEAGGQVSNFSGNLLSYERELEHVVASNGRIHSYLIGILQNIDLKMIVQW